MNIKVKQIGKPNLKYVAEALMSISRKRQAASTENEEQRSTKALKG